MGWDDGDKGNSWRPDGNKGPADLDAIVKDFQRRLSRLLGGRGHRRSGGTGGPTISSGLIAGGIVVLALIWVLSGFYKVDAAERGIVLRFGNYQTTTMPGPHWHLPWPIEKVEKINTGRVETWHYSGSMLTRDENIVDVELVVQYRRADPVKYLFSVREPEETLKDVTASAIREVVGKNDLDFILTQGRGQIAAKTKTLLQGTLDEYDSGIKIYEVNLQEANFPREVESAVQDAVKAREDRERAILEAQKYTNGVLPRAKGDAARKVQEAEAYRDQVVAQAQGDTARFLQILAQYEKAPEVTRRRMYLDTLEDVLEHSTKVLVSTGNSSNMLYLPIDKLLEARRNAPAANEAAVQSSAPAQVDSSSNAPQRQRGTR
ncbi:MAG TPA: FtsH protease activity modulator HflK [Gammaproteobacteria bacterium]|nr:FtsH protease activity modulator HflK [Gammaproteobacteria bacterium]